MKAVGAKRKTASPGQKITLDSATANPVKIEFVAVNGNGIETTNENDLSLVAVIRFGKFDAVMGGDLSGFDTGEYKDIESSVAGKVGQVEVYKVHHHCSRYSTNDKWLSVVKPKVGIISASGTIGRNHNHPTQECLERLHKAGVKTYWTETGGGAEPEPGLDVVGGNIVVEAEPNKRRIQSDLQLVPYRHLSGMGVNNGTDSDRTNLRMEQKIKRISFFGLQVCIEHQSRKLGKRKLAAAWKGIA